MLKKIFKLLHTEKFTFFEVLETQLPPRDPILGNVIESHYVIIVAWESTNFKWNSRF